MEDLVEEFETERVLHEVGDALEERKSLVDVVELLQKKTQVN